MEALTTITSPPTQGRRPSPPTSIQLPSAVSGAVPSEEFATVHGSSGLSATRRHPPPHAPRKHRATHQRNLSLDFRSMGIVLPPLPPSTYSGSHQRNRSLDSVLQRIPEVEGGETPQHPPPSNPPLKPSLSFTFSDAPSFKLRTDPCRTRALVASAVCQPVVVKRGKDPYDQTSLGSDDSGICSSEGETREPSTERAHSADCLDATFFNSDCEVKSIYSETLDGEMNMDDPEGDTVSDGGDLGDQTLVEDTGDISPSDITVIENMDSPQETDQGDEPLESPVESLVEETQATSELHTCSADNNDSNKENESKKECRSDVNRKGREPSDEGLSCSSSGASALVKTKLDEKQSLLLRLFESKLFDMSMAVSYLYKCKEPGVQQYIGNRLFSMPASESYFFLPQLVNMYVQTYEIAEVLHPFLVHLCRHDTTFALQCAWLLEAFSTDTAHQRKKSHGTKFKNLILSDELRPKQEGFVELGIEPKGSQHRPTLCTRIKEHPSPGSNPGSPVTELPPPFTTRTSLPTPSRKSHQRSRSDATVALQTHASATRGHKRTPSSGSIKNCLGDLTSGRAFDNGCTCFDSEEARCNSLRGKTIECSCGAPRLSPELEFVRAMISIGKRLGAQPTKEAKTSRLLAELSVLNLNLPARVYLPLCAREMPHHIVRIPPQAAVVLNSKDKVSALGF